MLGLSDLPDDLAAAFQELFVFVRILDEVGGEVDAVVVMRRKDVEELAGLLR